MKMVHRKIEQEIKWGENKHCWELVIENPGFLRGLLRDFSEGDFERDVNFLIDGEPLKMNAEIEAIFNPFKLDFNNKKAMSVLLKSLISVSNNENFYESTLNLKAQVLKHLSELVDAEQFDFEVETSDFLIDALAKAVNLRIIGDNDNFVELLVDYMAMMRDLVGIKIFVFINLQSMLTVSEYDTFIKAIFGKQFNILLIENKTHNMSTGYPIGRVMIDADLCEI